MHQQTNNLALKLDHCPIIGIKQSGKTTTGLKALAAHKNHLKFFFNTKLEKKWNPWCLKPAINSHNFKEVFKMIYKNPSKFKNGIIMINPDIGQGKKAITPILEFIIRKHQANNNLKTCMLIDEVHVFQSAHGIDPWIERVFIFGGIGLKVFAIAQTPNKIHGSIRDNSDSYILHYTKTSGLNYLVDKGLIQPEELEYFVFPSKYTAYVKYSEMQGWRKLQ